MVPSSGANRPTRARMATMAAPMTTLGLRTSMRAMPGRRAAGAGLGELGGQGLDAQ